MRISSDTLEKTNRRNGAVGRQKFYPGEKWDFVNLRLAPGTLSRLRAILRRGETQTELIRSLVEKEIERREAKGKKKG